VGVSDVGGRRNDGPAMAELAERAPRRLAKPRHERPEFFRKTAGSRRMALAKARGADEAARVIDRLLAELDRIEAGERRANDIRGQLRRPVTRTRRRGGLLTGVHGRGGHKWRRHDTASSGSWSRPRPPCGAPVCFALKPAINLSVNSGFRASSFRMTTRSFATAFRIFVTAPVKRGSSGKRSRPF
jgi:hypothetical protein